MAARWAGSLGIAWAMAVQAPAATIYVSPQGGHQPPFQDWPGAATNLAAAMAVAVSEDTIWVTNGVYGLTEELAVPPGVRLKSVSGSAVTVIDGNGTNRCVNLRGDGALVEGFTIRHGWADFGAGVRMGLGGTLRHCVVTQNLSTNLGGGGVYLRLGGLVENCLIVDNEARTGTGGGIQLLSGGMVRNSVIAFNRARVGGGAGLMFFSGMENCLVVSNTATQAGGIIMSQHSEVRHVTVARNEANAAGGVQGFYGGRIVSSIIYDNVAARGTNYLLLESADNQTEMIYSCTWPSWSGEGNIAEAPQWRNLAGGDFRLTLGSPCVDAAWGEESPTVDLFGGLRPRDGDGDGTALADMGAYEFAP